MRRHGAKLRQKCGRSSPIGQGGQRAQRILLANRQASADRIRIDAYALELVEKMRESFRL
jgi:hypothetical protein